MLLKSRSSRDRKGDNHLDEPQRRVCGTCSLCCKLLGFSIPELEKPAGQWCQHCRPGNGCAIYDRRPDGCREFTCLWLTGQFGLGEAWFPAKSKIVGRAIRTGKKRIPCVEFQVDPGWPNRWREEPYYSTIKKISALGLSLGDEMFATQVVVGETIFVILPNRDIKRGITVTPEEAEALCAEVDAAYAELEGGV